MVRTERVNWGSPTQIATMITLDGVESADVATFDEDVHFALYGRSATEGKVIQLEVGEYDDNGGIPQLTGPPVVLPDGFPTGTRVYDAAELPDPTNAAGGTQVLVGGPASPANVADAVIRVVTNGVLLPVTFAQYPNVVLRSVARHGLDGFIAVGDGGLILATVPDATGHHDLQNWTELTPPWMPAEPANLREVIRLGPANVMVGSEGAVWVWRPKPRSYSRVEALEPWLDWMRLDVDGGGSPPNLNGIAADDLHHILRPGADADDGDWSDGFVEQTGYALLVGDGGYVARFGVGMAERDLDHLTCESDRCPLTCTGPGPLCPPLVPRDLEIIPPTNLWGSVTLHDVWSDERTRTIVGAESTVWTFPRTAPMSETSLWWSRSPGPGYTFRGVASDHAAYMVVGRHNASNQAVAVFGTTRVKTCTVVADFQRPPTPPENTPAAFAPQFTFSLPLQCLEGSSAPVDGLDPGRVVTHLLGGDLELYGAVAVDTPTQTATLTFDGTRLTDNTIYPFWHLQSDVSSAGAREQREIVVIPEAPPRDASGAFPTSLQPDPAPPPVAPGCTPDWDQSLNDVSSVFSGLVFGRTTPTTRPTSAPQPISRTASGSRVIPGSLWVDLLTGIRGNGTVARSVGALDTCDWQPLGTYHDAWLPDANPATAPDDLDDTTGVESLIAGFSRQRNAEEHGMIDDYEREIDGRDPRLMSMKHDFIGRCFHGQLNGFEWPDAGYAAACCDVDDPTTEPLDESTLPVNTNLDLYAPYRARVYHIGLPRGLQACDGQVIDLENTDPNYPYVINIPNVSGVSDLPEAPDTQIQCPVTHLGEITVGAGVEPYTRMVGSTFLVWEPGPNDPRNGSVVMVIDNIDVCWPVNDDPSSNGQIIEAGERFGLLSVHSRMDVGVWVNDHHDRWRLLSYFDMLPDALYDVYEAKFGFPNRTLQATPPVVVPLAERDRCPAWSNPNPGLQNPVDIDAEGIALACIPPVGTVGPAGEFVPTADVLIEHPGALLCPIRSCTRGVGGGGSCTPDVDVCPEKSPFGGCTLATAFRGTTPACAVVGAETICYEVDCPLDQYLRGPFNAVESYP